MTGKSQQEAFILHFLIRNEVVEDLRDLMQKHMAIWCQFTAERLQLGKPFAILFLLTFFPLMAFPDGRSDNPTSAPIFWSNCTDLLTDKEYTWDGPLTDSGNFYEMDFLELFKKLGVLNTKTFFQDWIADRHARGLKVNALDLMGSGFHVSNADSMTGLRFAPLPGNRLQGHRIPPQVYGDIRKQETWDAFDRSLGDRHLSGIDLATMRPIGGWSSDGEIPLLKFIIKNMRQRLNAGGEFYFYIPSRTIEKMARENSFQTSFNESLQGLEVVCESRRQFSGLIDIGAQCLIRKPFNKT